MSMVVTILMAMTMVTFGPAVRVLQEAPLLAGLAEVEITPPLGYRTDGYFMERLNTGTKDPLKAKALVFKQGDTKIALVVADVVGIPPVAVE